MKPQDRPLPSETLSRGSDPGLHYWWQRFQLLNFYGTPPSLCFPVTGKVKRSEAKQSLESLTEYTDGDTHQVDPVCWDIETWPAPLWGWTVLKVFNFSGRLKLYVSTGSTTVIFKVTLSANKGATKKVICQHEPSILRILGMFKLCEYSTLQSIMLQDMSLVYAARFGTDLTPKLETLKNTITAYFF